MKRVLKDVRFLFIPGLAIVLAAAINCFLLINAYVPSESMDPTIPPNSMVLGLRGAYQAESPKTGDIIFFRHEELGGSLLIKRVIALPKQTVELKAGRVYIEGQPLTELYIENFSEDDFGPLLVPDNCCFVLGDNRKASKDARHWAEPFVSFDAIEGKAVWLWFPQIKRLN